VRFYSVLRTILDDLLEITIVASFSRAGYALRRRLWGWTVPPDAALAGRTVLVTGPTSGLGRATATALAGLGARVVLVGRSAERLEKVRAELTAAHGEDRFPTVVADMGSLESVRAAAAQILEQEPRLDVVVDNAGAIYAERKLSPDGIEQTLATLVVGPFVLISELLPLIGKAGAGRVIAVASGGMYAQRLHLDDLQYAAGTYDGTRAYARAKRAQVALMREWARRRADSGVAFSAMHPGWVDTAGLAESLPGFYRVMRPVLRTIEEGIDTVVWLAAHPDAAGLSGQLLLDRRPRPFDRIPATRLSADDRRRLWNEIVALGGGPDPAPAD
jgi:dehydrogenase/reductase SDR family member 12